MEDSGGLIGGIIGFVFVLFYLALVIGLIAGFWKVFTKAGHPGWAAIVPIYNIYILVLIAGRPGWWVLLMLIPIVNIFVSIIVSLDVAKAFGQSAIFGIGLWFFGFVFYPILGFGSAQYQGV